MENIYTDIDLSFIKHPLTGDISALKDEIAIKRSISHLILTNIGDKPWNPESVTNLNELLFENVNIVILDAIRSRIQFIIETGEPRIKILDITITPNENDLNAIDVVIYFSIINLNREFTTKVNLQKVR